MTRKKEIRQMKAVKIIETIEKLFANFLYSCLLPIII